MQRESFFRKLRNKLRKLQRADEATKRRWFFGISSISVVVVLFAWLLYMKTFLTPNKSNTIFPTFADTLKVGMENITTDLGNKYEIFKKNLDKKMSAIEKKINETNTITIEGPSTTSAPFVPKNLEKLPEIPLP